MGLRETVSYDKNLITGELRTLKKYKDCDAPMINTTTVELFDALTGEKVHEAKSENIINNNVAKLAYMEFLYQRIKGSSSNSYYTTPFQTIVLTDYTGAEDANDWALKGNIIGYADKTSGYVGPDTTRGTINASESVLTEVSKSGYLHFVFDFPTHAANGTINTIWWTKDITFVMSNIYTSAIPSASNFIRTFINGGYVDFNSNMTAGMNIPIYDAVTLINTNVTVTPLNLPIITASGMDYDKTNVWIVDYSRLKIHKFTDNMSSWLSSVPMTGWNTLWGTAIQDITTLNGKIYAITNFYNIVIIDPLTGACLSSKDMRPMIGASVGATSSYNGITTDGVSKIFFIGIGQYIIVDFNLNYIGYFATTGTSGYRLTFDKDKYLLITSNGTPVTCKYLLLIASVGAQNLLAAPINKTTSFTMKITYDFQIQKLW